MANKQTKRERKELAKRERMAAQKRAARRRQLQRMYGIGTVVAIIVVIFGLISLAGAAQRKRDSRLNKLAAAAGCDSIKKSLEPGDPTHIQPGATVNYRTSPPTSGNHYGAGEPNGPAFTGVHTQPIQNEVQVHNLEHGHIGIQYKPEVPKPVSTAVEAIAAKPALQPWVFVAPNPSMTPAFALSAWGKLVACPDASKLDVAKVTALANEFVTQYRDKSPREHVAGNPIPPGTEPAASASPSANASAKK